MYKVYTSKFRVATYQLNTTRNATADNSEMTSTFYVHIYK